MKYLVIGSANVDYTTYVNEFPKPGETLLGNDFHSDIGGKGANQACAIGKLGGDVTFLCSMGNDVNQERIIKTLKDNHVKAVVKTSQSHTGIATILVNRSSKNQIVVVPGANSDLDIDFLKQHQSHFREADVIILQLEIPLPTVAFAAQLAYNLGKIVLINPAPAKVLDEALLAHLDFVTPNETELSLISGCPATTMEERIEASRQLLRKGVKSVITTLGEQGALLVNSEKEILFPAIKVKAVDTVAAGDCFNGAFAFYLSHGIEEAIRFANKAAAVAVTRFGAIASLPTIEDIH